MDFVLRARLTSTDETVASANGIEDSESKVDWEMDRSRDMLGSYGRTLILMVTRSALSVFLL